MKKVFSLLSLFIIVALVSFTTLNNKKLIVIDAGHGGHDNGTSYAKWNEKDIVEQISKKIFELNDPSKVEIVLLRDTDNYISLTDRVNKINELNPDLVISLHINANATFNASGIEAFVSEKNSNHLASKEHAEKLIESIANDKLKSRGVKPANFFILKNSKCPSVLLDLGFITNENDRKYITSEEGQKEIAENIVNSIQ